MAKQRRLKIIDQAKAEANREKRVTKALKGCDYTPFAAKIMAGVLCHLSKEEEQRRKEVLGIFQRVVNGGDK